MAFHARTWPIEGAGRWQSGAPGVPHRRRFDGVSKSGGRSMKPINRNLTLRLDAADAKVLDNVRCHARKPTLSAAVCHAVRNALSVLCVALFAQGSGYAAEVWRSCRMEGDAVACTENQPMGQFQDEWLVPWHRPPHT